MTGRVRLARLTDLAALGELSRLSQQEHVDARSLGLPVKLHFGIVTKAKTPVVQIFPVPTDADRVAAMTESVAAVWEAIQGGNFYPAPHPMNCSTCPFRSRCPVFGGQ